MTAQRLFTVLLNGSIASRSGRAFAPRIRRQGE